MVPIDVTVDQNNVVTSGTFGNSSFFSENVLLDGKTTFWNVIPMLSWQPSETFHLDAQVNYEEASSTTATSPAGCLQTPRRSGVEPISTTPTASRSR